MHLRTSIIIAAFLIASGCTKKNNNTIIYNNTYNNDATPAYIVSGLHDIEFVNGFTTVAGLPLTIQYMDSAQQTVKLSLSELPEGIEVDSNWIKSGVPTYSTMIWFRSTSDTMTTGSFPVTLTATNDSGQQKVFSININITPIPQSLMGKYSHCLVYCPVTVEYTDSLYLDPVISNKIWFTNFANSGNLVYGYMTGGVLVIPEQTFGTTTYDHSGTFSIGDRHINMSMGTSCAMDMN